MATAVTDRSKQKIILIDGDCIMCTRFSKFVLRWDRKKQFLFASQQSAQGRSILKHYIIPPDTDSIMLFDEGQLWLHSSAILNVFKYLGLPWQAMVLFKIVPRPLRDGVYRMIAAMRYKLFGKHAPATCELLSPEERDRMLY